MKVVLDTMLWVSYCTRRNGSRHRLIDQALKARVRLFVSDYILDELTDVLREEMSESARYVHLARRAVLRRAKRVDLPENIRSFVPRDSKDDAVVQTAVSAKADYLVTADAVLLELGKVRNVRIINVKTFAERLAESPGLTRGLKQFIQQVGRMALLERRTCHCLPDAGRDVVCEPASAASGKQCELGVARTLLARGRQSRGCCPSRTSSGEPWHVLFLAAASANSAGGALESSLNEQGDLPRAW